MRLPTLACVALLLACGTLRNYPGEVRATDEVAQIRPRVAVGREIRIQAADGRPLGLFEDRVEVLPGRHALRVHVTLVVATRKVRAQRVLRFEAIRGHAYVVDADFEANAGPRIWVTDTTAGVRVAVAETRLPGPSVGAGPR